MQSVSANLCCAAALEACRARSETTVQTFLPYSSFVRSARALDDKRLGKQRVETLQVLRALHFPSYGWQHHVVVRMWRGYVPALVVYGETICHEWKRRGWQDRCGAQISEFRARGEPATRSELRRRGALPPWLGSRKLHRSHQSRLIQKDPGFYRSLFPGVPGDLPYFWPASDVTEVPPRGVAAWVLRPPDPETLEPVAGDRASLPWRLPDSRGPTTRRRRQTIENDLQRVRRGDRVVVPRDDEVFLAELEEVRAEPSERVVVTVRWRGRASRGELFRPGLLQNPQPFFPLRGRLFAEPAREAGRRP